MIDTILAIKADIQHILLVLLAVWRCPRAPVHRNPCGNFVARGRRQSLAVRHQSTFHGRRDRTSRSRSDGFRRTAGNRGNGQPAIPALASRTAGFGGPHAFRAGANRICPAGLFHSFDRTVLWSHRHLGRGHLCPSATQAAVRVLCCMDDLPSDRAPRSTASIIGRPADLHDRHLSAFLRSQLGGPTERLCALYAGSDRRWCYATSFTQGQGAGVAVRLRVLIELGIQHNAGSFLVAHGHPSGRANPSEQDIAATRRLLTIANAIDLFLLDHLIVAGNCVFSMRTGKAL